MGIAPDRMQRVLAGQKGGDYTTETPVAAPL